MEEQENWIQAVWKEADPSTWGIDLDVDRDVTKAERNVKFITWRKALDDLSFMMREVIPVAGITERQYWTLSDYPSTGGGKRLSALSVGVIEQLVQLRPSETFTADGQPIAEFADGFAFLNAFGDEEILRDLDGDFMIELEGWEFPVFIMKHSYNLFDTVAHYFPIGRLEELLSQAPVLLAAAREYAVKNMRFRNGGLFRRFHSHDLALAAFQHAFC